MAFLPVAPSPVPLSRPQCLQLGGHPSLMFCRIIPNTSRVDGARLPTTLCSLLVLPPEQAVLPLPPDLGQSAYFWDLLVPGFSELLSGCSREAPQHDFHWKSEHYPSSLPATGSQFYVPLLLPLKCSLHLLLSRDSQLHHDDLSGRNQPQHNVLAQG